jgi:hypothetical protein
MQKQVSSTIYSIASNNPIDEFIVIAALNNFLSLKVSEKLFRLSICIFMMASK